MVLISIQPFHLRKLFLFGASVLFLSSAFCFGDPLFMSVRTMTSNQSECGIQRPVESPRSQLGETQAEASIDLRNTDGAISFFTDPPLIAQTEIGTWLGVTEMDLNSWSAFPSRQCP